MTRGFRKQYRLGVRFDSIYHSSSALFDVDALGRRLSRQPDTASRMR
jgi:hypothetical protein